MNGNKLALALVTSAVLLIGCQSTTSNVIYNKDKLVKYESRCDDVTRVEEDSRASPILTVNPSLPYKAAKNQIPGYVKMEFDISERGEPININVVESFPDELFHGVAVAALKKWRYEPKASECQSVQLDFKFA
ncbi:MAG: TonB family protein [Alteromonadaceae bacterium]|nr:TonB family protein [Alteromonadaceae bacterium]